MREIETHTKTFGIYELIYVIAHKIFQAVMVRGLQKSLPIKFIVPNFPFSSDLKKFSTKKSILTFDYQNYKSHLWNILQYEN